MVEGGLELLNYQWSMGNMNIKIVNFSLGFYSLMVMDDNGCYDIISIIINEFLVLNIDFLVQQISCVGVVDGSVNVMLSGGVVFYYFFWGIGDIMVIINELDVGIYGLIVEDQNVCIEVVSVEIIQFVLFELIFLIEKEFCEGNVDGIIYIEV